MRKDFYCQINTTAQVSFGFLGHNIFDINDLCRPFRAGKIAMTFYPRALPWAIIFCPFRAKAVSQ